MRSLRRLGLCLCSALPIASTVHAQADFPVRSVRIVVPFAPGGSADTMARLLAGDMAKGFGQPVVVDNRPGGGGTIGVDAVVKSPPDGHTIGLAAVGALAINVHFMKLPYDPAKDLAPVTLLAHIPMVLAVHPATGIESVKDLIVRAKEKPGALAFGTTGNGSAMHLSGEMLRLMTGAVMTHVPYKGSAPAMMDAVAGQIPVAIVDLTSALPHIRAGKVKGLATLGARRSVSAPDLPTMAEAGVAGFDAVGWFGLVAPAATPREVVARLSAEVNRVLQLPEVRNKALAAGTEPATNTPAEFAAFIAAELPKWERLVKAAGITQQ